jgi:PRTRC genetic system protein E
MTMFAALAPIVRGNPLTLTLTMEEGKLSVIIAGKGPTPTWFAQPVRVVGTPEELDAALPGELARYTELAEPATDIALPAPTARAAKPLVRALARPARRAHRQRAAQELRAARHAHPAHLHRGT